MTKLDEAERALRLIARNEPGKSWLSTSDAQALAAEIDRLRADAPTTDDPDLATIASITSEMLDRLGPGWAASPDPDSIGAMFWNDDFRQLKVSVFVAPSGYYSVAVETDYAAASLGEAATFVRVLTSDLRAAARLADIGLRPGGGN